MTRRRKNRTVVGGVLALLALLPAAASASSLLSGYGGPGQGSQAILGSGLVRGAGGAGGSGTPPTSPVSGPVATKQSQTPAALTRSGAGARRGHATKAGSGRTPGNERKDQGAGQTEAGTRKSVSLAYAAAERGAPVAASETLGFSGDDLLLLILALGALASIAAVTRRLAQAPSVIRRDR